MPRASSSSSRASPSQPGNEKCALPGSRWAVDRSGSPPSTASGTTSSTRRTRSSRSPASCSARSRWPFAATSAAAASPTMAGVSRVPERTSRSWPPPCSTGTRSWVAAEDEQPGAQRPADLVTGDRHGVQTARREVDGQLPEGLHGVGVERHAVRPGDRRQLGDRLHRADLVVRPHHGRPARPTPGPRRSRPRSVSGCTRPAASTGSHSTTAPSCSASHRAASITAWCSTALARMRLRRRVLAAALPVQALDGEVVRLGAAAGEEDLARPRTQGRGERLAGLLDQPAGSPAGGVQRRRVAGPAEARGHRLDRLGDHRSGRRVVEVDRAGLGTAVDGWGHRRRSLRR